MKRYYIRTSYHVWSIIDRATDKLVVSYGARGRGDKAAKQLAHDECDRLNEKAEQEELCANGEHLDIEDWRCLLCGEWVIT